MRSDIPPVSYRALPGTRPEREWTRRATPSPADVGTAGEHVVDVAGRDSRDVAPDRALQRRDRIADLDGILARAPRERRREESRDECVAGADRVDHLHGVP